MVDDVDAWIEAIASSVEDKIMRPVAGDLRDDVKDGGTARAAVDANRNGTIAPSGLSDGERLKLQREMTRMSVTADALADDRDERIRALEVRYRRLSMEVCELQAVRDDLVATIDALGLGPLEERIMEKQRWLSEAKRREAEWQRRFVELQQKHSARIDSLLARTTATAPFARRHSCSW